MKIGSELISILALLIMIGSLFMVSFILSDKNSNYKECVKYHKPIDCATGSP